MNDIGGNFRPRRKIVAAQKPELQPAVKPIPQTRTEILKQKKPTRQYAGSDLLQGIWEAKWRLSGGILLILILTAVAVLPKLGSLVSPFTTREQPVSLGITEFENLIENPFFLPEKAIQAAFVYTNHPSVTYFRLVSVGFAIAALVIFYWLLTKWHTRRIAVLAVIMFGTSSWFLHQARWAEHEVMYLSVIPVLLLGSILLKKKKYDRLWPLTLFVISLLLYLPGVWALVVLFLIFNHQKIGKTLKYLSGPLHIMSGAALTIPLIPLIYSFWKAPWLILTWLGLPEKGLTFQSVLMNLYEIPKQLFINGPNDPLRWLSGTPVLDAATVALIVIGIYSYKSGLYPLRWRALAGLSLASIILISLGGLIGLSLIIPLAYIFAANGIALMLQQWFTVFPRNPFARSIGIIAVMIVVFAACSYQLTRYYVAWPNSPATHEAVHEQRL